MNNTERLCEIAEHHAKYLKTKGMNATADLIHELVFEIAELTADEPNGNPPVRVWGGRYEGNEKE